MFENAEAPRFIITSGLLRSGSTWIYNAVLALARDSRRTRGLYTDEFPADLSTLINDTDTIVIKSHFPQASLAACRRFFDCPVLVSVRDPRDCVVSLMEAFSYELDEAIDLVSRSLHSVVDFAESGPCLLMKYEKLGTLEEEVHRVARFIGLDPAIEQVRHIAQTLAPETVKQEIAMAMESGELNAASPRESFLREKHWHPNHVGSGASNKHVGKLALESVWRLGAGSGDLLARAGYSLPKPPAIAENCLLDFGRDGALYATTGFSYREDVGVWTKGAEARLAIPLKSGASMVRVELSLIVGPALRPSDGESARGVVRVQNQEVANIGGAHDPESLLLVYNARCEGLLNIDFIFEGLRSPRDLGLSTDGRLLGICLRTVRLTFF